MRRWGGHTGAFERATPPFHAPLRKKAREKIRAAFSLRRNKFTGEGFMQKANGGRIFGLQEKSLARCVTETNISFLVGSLWGRGGCIVLLRNRPRGPTRQIACSLAGAAGAAKSCEHFTSSRSLLTNSPLRFRPFDRTIALNESRSYRSTCRRSFVPRSVYCDLDFWTGVWCSGGGNRARVRAAFVTAD